MASICAETDTTDELSALVILSQAGDREALGEIARRFESLVYSIALRRLRNHAEAQELTQEVFVQVLRKIGQLRDPACLAGWLRSITHRLAINRALRGGGELPTEPASFDARQHDAHTPELAAMQREQASQVRAGLRRLRSLDRQTLEAFYVDGRSLVEMSTKFDTPLGTIKRRLHVARKRLAHELETLATL